MLGIHEHASPAAATQMARSACAAASLEEAAAWLRDTGGLEVDVKTLRRITRRFGQRARAALPDNLQVLQVGGQGRSVVISMDRTFTPLIDGTLGGADALFEMLWLYLPLFNALQPARVLRQRTHGKRDPPGDQPPTQGAGYLLARGVGRGHDHDPLLLQGPALG